MIVYSALDPCLQPLRHLTSQLISCNIPHYEVAVVVRDNHQMSGDLAQLNFDVVVTEPQTLQQCQMTVITTVFYRQPVYSTACLSTIKSARSAVFEMIDSKMTST